MVRQHQTSDVQLHIGESRDCGFDAEPVIGPRFARTRWHRPGMTKSGLLRRGACHRARIRATRWLLAMTLEEFSERHLLVPALLAGEFHAGRALFSRNAIWRAAFSANSLNAGIALLHDDGLARHGLADQALGLFAHRLLGHPACTRDGNHNRLIALRLRLATSQ